MTCRKREKSLLYRETIKIDVGDLLYIMRKKKEPTVDFFIDLPIWPKGLLLPIPLVKAMEVSELLAPAIDLSREARWWTRKKNPWGNLWVAVRSMTPRTSRNGHFSEGMPKDQGTVHSKSPDEAQFYRPSPGSLSLSVHVLVRVLQK